MPIRDEYLPHCECPVSLELFADPVIVQSGHSLDRSNAQGLINRGQPNPLTRGPLNANDLRTPNTTLKNYIAQDGNYPLVDPVTREPLIDPVVLLGSDGFSYNRTTLTERPELNPNRLLIVTNFKLKDLIEEISKHENRTQLAMPQVVSKAAASPSNALEHAAALYDANDFQKALVAYQGLTDVLTGSRKAYALHRLGMLKAKFSQHQNALADLTKALDQLSGANSYSRNTTAISRDEIDKYMQIALDANQISRILAAQDNPRHYFDAAKSFCHKGIKASEALPAPLTPKQLHLKCTLIEDQIWAINGLCDHQPKIVNDLEITNLTTEKISLVNELKKLTAEPKHPLMMLKRAQYHFLVSDHMQAIIDCNRAIAHPEESSMDKEDRIKLRLQLALSLSESKNYSLALEHLQGALMLRPTHRASLYAKAKAHFELKQYAEAIRACEHSLRVAPNDNPMLILQAKANMGLGKLNEANDSLICIAMGSKVDKRDQGHANALLHEILLMTNPRQDVGEPKYNGILLGASDFVTQVKNNAQNLNQIQSRYLIERFENLMMNESNDLNRYIEDIFKATKDSSVITGQELYRCIFMMERMGNDMSLRNRYSRVLGYIQKVQTRMKNGAQIMWNEPNCHDYAEKCLLKYDENKSPGNQSFHDEIVAAISTKNGTAGQTPGGIVAQSHEMASVARVHSNHVKDVVKMLKSNDTNTQRQWQEHVTQMLLKNPKFPNVNEYYLALTVLKNELGNEGLTRDVNVILTNIIDTEKNLRASGAIDAIYKTCEVYAAENLHRGKPKPGANDPNATRSDYQGSGAGVAYQAPKPQAYTPPPAEDYTRYRSSGGS